MKTKFTISMYTFMIIFTLISCGGKGKKDSGKKIISSSGGSITYPLSKLALTLPNGARATLNDNTDSIAKGDLNG
ncbi:MAG: hypothetical protein KDD52_09405, partial [Bdellovibrionales bacterium]|nr:hypothetical protein [Bdellovibrionales bacterium]